MPQNDLTSVSRAQTASPRPRKVPRVVVLGGGSVGLYAARRLRKKLGRREAAIVVVDPRPYMTYAPFLPEAAAGSLTAATSSRRTAVRSRASTCSRARSSRSTIRTAA